MAETKYPTTSLRVPVPAYKRLTALQEQLSDERQRPVPYGEVVERLLDCWDEVHVSKDRMSE